MSGPAGDPSSDNEASQEQNGGESSTGLFELPQRLNCPRHPQKRVCVQYYIVWRTVLPLSQTIRSRQRAGCDAFIIHAIFCVHVPIDPSSKLVLKIYLESTVQGAEEMGEAEHKLNVYVQKNAPGSCAEFFGYTMVEKSDRVADKRITPGKWLVRLHSSVW